MSLLPDHLFVQSFTLIYFCSWLWLNTSTGIIRIRESTKYQVGVLIGLVLIVVGIVWCYLCLRVLADGGTPFQLPLTVELTLILIMATTYFPLRPWRNWPVSRVANFVRVARVELAVLVVGLPIASVIRIGPLSAYMMGWFSSLVEDNTVLCVLISGLTIYEIAVCERKARGYLSAAFVVVIALTTTYVKMFTALVSTI